jgi:AcrR family transcriptional regulator
MGTTTRERILDAGAELFRRQGYTGTGLKQLVAKADAPFGSLYHHFPGGKDELTAEIIRRSAGYYLDLFDEVVGADADVVEGVRRFFHEAADVLEATDYADGCPIAVVALEVASTNDQLREATHDVFEAWLFGLTIWFSAAGIAEDVARRLAVHALAALEGAFLLSRAAKDPEAMRVTGDAVAAAVEAALA